MADDENPRLPWCTVARDGQILEANGQARAAFGGQATIFDAVAGADRVTLLAAIAAPDTAPQPFEVRVRAAAGWHVYSMRVEARDDGACTVWAEEITESHHLRALLAAQREVLDQIVTRAPIATALDAIARMVESVAPEALALVYLRRDQALELAAAPNVPAAFGRAAAGVAITDDDPLSGTLSPLSGPLARLALEHGLGFGWWATVVDEAGDDLGRFVLLAGEKRFLTAQERARCEDATRLIAVAVATARDRRRVADAEARDPLTGLLHRVALLEAIEPDARSGSVVLLVEVGAVRAVNARLGFEAGDVLLLAVAEQLRRTLRSRDLLARWSGTRFAVVGGARRGDGGLLTLLDRVERALGGDVMVAGERLDPGCRILGAESGHAGPIALLQRLEHEAACDTDRLAAEARGSEDGTGGR